MGQINNIRALIQIMAWCRPGDKPLPELMMASVGDAYICIFFEYITLWTCFLLISQHWSQGVKTILEKYNYPIVPHCQ